MATFSLQVSPFPVPTHVTLVVPSSGKREDGIRQPVQIALADIPEDTLTALIEEFAQSVLKAAGRST